MRRLTLGRMRARGSVVRLIALTAALGACGSDSPTPVVIPDVPVGAFEAGCQELCTLGDTETICTPKHSEFCVARCRAATRDLPQACGDCRSPRARPSWDPRTVSATAATPAASAICRLRRAGRCATTPAPPRRRRTSTSSASSSACSTPTTARAFACSVDAVGDDCLVPCQATIAMQGRICAQCVVGENVGHGRSASTATANV